METRVILFDDFSTDSSLRLSSARWSTIGFGLSWSTVVSKSDTSSLIASLKSTLELLKKVDSLLESHFVSVVVHSVVEKVRVVKTQFLWWRVEHYLSLP